MHAALPLPCEGRGTAPNRPFTQIKHIKTNEERKCHSEVTISVATTNSTITEAKKQTCNDKIEASEVVITNSIKYYGKL